MDAWLVDLDLTVVERAEREGVSSWDLQLDGLRRADIRVTIILDPQRALLLWVHFAPQLNDSFRVSYRQLLRWNDELPFVKFGLADDERLVLTTELATGELDRDVLGRAICRLLAVCDLTLDRARGWLTMLPTASPDLTRESRQAGLFARYGEIVEELLTGAAEEDALAAPASSAAHQVS